ncbi:MAG: type II toxin-antitoxin system HicA family toxin [Thermodesulfobacteriota bacterium]
MARARQGDGWRVVRQKGSYIRLEKLTEERLLKLTVPAHNPVKRSTFAHTLRQPGLTAADLAALT